MPAILLVRHAQASYGGDDYDVLSKRGHDQAAAVHRALSERGTRADRLVSGSLRRQRDSAAPWTEAGAQLEIDARFDEYDAADLLEAHSAVAASIDRQAGAPQLESRDFQTILDDALYAWIAAGSESAARETWTAFRERVEVGLSDIADSLSRGQNAVVITSGGVIALCCVITLGVSERTFVTLNHVTVNAGVTKLVSGRRGTTLVSFNEHAHLDPLGLVTYR